MASNRNLEMPNFPLPEKGSTQSSGLSFNNELGVWEQSSKTIPNTQEGVDRATTPSDSVPQSSGENSDVKIKAEQGIIVKEVNTLIGTLELLPVAKSFKVVMGCTIRLKGIGKYLSGVYLVSKVESSLSTSGFKRILTVIKTGFGDSLKGGYDEEVNAPDIVSVSVPYSIGDTVKINADDAVYSNSVPVPESVKNRGFTVQSISQDGERVLLKEINSWTYVKYIERA